MGIHVQCHVHIGMAKQFLYFLGRCAERKQVTRIRVTESVKMKTFKAFKSLSDNCTLLDDILRMDKSTIGLSAHEVNSGVLQRWDLIGIELIDLVVDSSVIVDLCEVVPLVIASEISFSLLLLQSGFSKYFRKRVTKVDGPHLAALGWADLHFVS